MLNPAKTACLAAVAIIAMTAEVCSLQTPRLSTVRSNAKIVTYAYIPAGFTKESWDKFQQKEKAKKTKTAAKNLGRMGPKGFQSRSMQSFQEALEKGEAAHLLPVFNAKQKIASGELKKEDIPVCHFDVF